MLNWVSQNSQAITALANIGTLIVWFVYAQLLYSNFRRQRTPSLIINRGRQKDIDALCIISNMSKEPVYIEFIIAELETSKGTVTMDVTDLEQSQEAVEKQTEEASIATSDQTRQGPLESGAFITTGTFRAIVSRLSRQAHINAENEETNIELLSLKIQLICVYGPEDKPIAAEREFDLRKHKEYGTLIPTTWNTKQLSSKRQRKGMQEKVAKLEERNFTYKSNLTDEGENTERK